MAKVKEINSALQLKLNLISKITELLKQEKVNVTDMKISLKTFVKKKRTSIKSASNMVQVNGTLILKINSRLNPDMNMELDDETDDELLTDIDND